MVLSTSQVLLERLNNQGHLHLRTRPKVTRLLLNKWQHLNNLALLLTNTDVNLFQTSPLRLLPKHPLKCLHLNKEAAVQLILNQFQAITKSTVRHQSPKTKLNRTLPINHLVETNIVKQRVLLQKTMA